RRAFARFPWLYEAKRLEGDVLMAMADRLGDRSDYLGSLEKLDNAGEAYEAAEQFGRSDPMIQVGQAKRWVETLGAWSLGLGRPPGAHLASIKAAVARVLQADPNQIEAKRLQMRGYQFLIQYQEVHGQTGPELTEAIQLAEQLRKQHPA